MHLVENHSLGGIQLSYKLGLSRDQEKGVNALSGTPPVGHPRKYKRTDFMHHLWISQFPRSQCVGTFEEKSDDLPEVCPLQYRALKTRKRQRSTVELASRSSQRE